MPLPLRHPSVPSPHLSPCSLSTPLSLFPHPQLKPNLTFQNQTGWNAPRRSLILVHPHGAASKVSNEVLNISFAPTPDYAGIAKAAAGGNLWAGRAGTVEELGRLLPEAVQSVLNGTGAVLDAHLDGPQGKFGGGVGGTSG